MPAIQEQKLSHLQADGEESLGDESSEGDEVDDDSRPSDAVDSKDKEIYGKEAQEEIAKRETQNVFRLRMLVFGVLLVAAAAVSLIVLYITKNAQIHEFETQYAGAAKQVIEAFGAIVEEKIGAISALAVAAIAHGIDHHEAWPFVTLSSFQQRSATAQSLSDCLFVAVAPLVNETDREQWESYVVGPDSKWITDGYKYQDKIGMSNFLDPQPEDVQNQSDSVTSDSIFYFDTAMKMDITVDPGPGPYMPIWLTSPILRRKLINENILQNPVYSKWAQRSWETSKVVIGGFEMAPRGYRDSEQPSTSFYATILSVAARKDTFYEGDPMSTVYLPIFNSFNAKNRYPSALLFAVMRWAKYFENILPPNVKGVVVVLENGCDGAYTYEIDGPDVRPIGLSDLHSSRFNGMVKTSSFEGFTHIADGTETGVPLLQGECSYRIRVYPSETFYHAFNSNTPAIITFAVAIIFLFTTLMFLVYDRLVERRQQLILRKALQSSAIVSSLFPKNVRDRLMQDVDGTAKKSGFDGPNTRLKSYLKGYATDNELGVAPIADLFPHATVLFSDIAGFTAWSSTRDPAQVFVLLQAVYQAFDNLAQKRGVFKVETIGDSYVAVTGLPEPQERHAIIMARFAGECMVKMNEVVKDLEVSLGPDTGDLSMRMGLHSGPVTAGVLRGERSRFQLFGDTVNTAARMESTGIPNRIQISQSTADLLIESGKEHWVKPRQDAIEAKGKGVMKTFWLNPSARKEDSVSSSEPIQDVMIENLPSENLYVMADLRHNRLVNWICELLSEHLKNIIARRRALGHNDESPCSLWYMPEGDVAPLDEVVEAINLPKFDAKVAAQANKVQNIQLSKRVTEQLHEYVTTIASTYHDNPFHNFEHACHVTMAVNKFLKRIVAPDLDVKQFHGNMASHLHDYTHGITSDPLSHLAIVFSALIHDADHRGVSNLQLIKEDEQLGKLYKEKSVAEQNSLDLSWEILMSPGFEDLRRTMFLTNKELFRFRQIIVNVVLATDIFDKELNDLRKIRWDKAFNKGDKERARSNDDLKATIVIEHIIQASDVAHTMQHWHIYRKWNKRLFTEMYRAYKTGRMGIDPSTFWYNGELGFFDNYIIPLAKKLKDCNVFGVSSDECLNYAIKNRFEWEQRGKEIVEEMISELATAQPPSEPKDP